MGVSTHITILKHSSTCLLNKIQIEFLYCESYKQIVNNFIIIKLQITYTNTYIGTIYHNRMKLIRAAQKQWRENLFSFKENPE